MHSIAAEALSLALCGEREGLTRLLRSEVLVKICENFRHEILWDDPHPSSNGIHVIKNSEVIYVLGCYMFVYKTRCID